MFLYFLFWFECTFFIILFVILYGLLNFLGDKFVDKYYLDDKQVRGRRKFRFDRFGRRKIRCRGMNYGFPGDGKCLSESRTIFLPVRGDHI